MRIPAAGFDFSLKAGALPPVTALAYSPDGKTLAVGGYRNVVLWDTTTGRPVSCVMGLAGAALSLAFRPDGLQLAIASGTAGIKGEARLYDMKKRALTPLIFAGHTDVVYSVAWTHDGKLLATGSHDKTARIWDAATGKESKVLREAADSVTCVCFAPDGKSLYTASLDHSLRRYDVEKGTLTRAYSGHDEGVTAFAVTVKGDQLVSADLTARMRWWNVDSGENVRDTYGQDGTALSLNFSVDGKRLLSCAASGAVRVCGSDGGVQRSLEGFHDWVYAAVYSPDGKFTAGAGADGLVRLWETESGKLRLTLLTAPTQTKDGPCEWIAAAPEGWFDASEKWTAIIQPLVVGKKEPAAAFAKVLLTFRQSANVLKAWQGAALTPVSLPAPPMLPTPAPVKK